MCRSLVNVIEELLISFNVEKLVITAIPNIVETWTKLVQEAEGRTLNKINLMVFPVNSYKKEMNRQRKRGKRHKQKEDEIHTGRKQNQHTQLMAKRNKERPYPFQFPKSKGCKRMSMEDKISALPDDTLLTILSLLTFKEVVATSILSQRWRYLWTCLPSLNFRYEEVVPRNDDEGNKKQCHRPIIGMHSNGQPSAKVSQGATAARLELNFSCYLYPIGSHVKSYSLPLNLFDKTKGLEPYLVQPDCVFSIPTSSLNVQNRFKSLRELLLKFVDVTDDQFDTILSSCTSLECLHLLESSRLVNVKHSVPHMKLNYLEIYNCSDLENIEIFAPNLVSFKYRGSRIYIFWMNIQLKILWVYLIYKGNILFLANLGIRGSNKVPLLCNLKHLTLSCLNASRDPFGMLRCYHLVASFAKASPFLHWLKLHFSLYSTENPELRRIPISPHKYLKKVTLPTPWLNKGRLILLGKVLVPKQIHV
ncbi:hypothetical protein CXB51_014469 [Gossypium anomalum]|uniref:F-box domain-containing protein n=1 Tax=Gossypium anomalum TaxID=47600 RepID=A0A8J6D2P5_9ROSI|nr:hypothetical protein CXB51_014469 [Gossypium anomalum]